MSATFLDYYDKHKGKDILVLGCGVSVKDIVNYDLSDVITVGVNDIGELYDPDYLLCVDRPERFNAHRRSIIQNNKSKYFITQLINEWNFKDGKHKIRIEIGRNRLANWKSVEKNSVIDTSNNSPYMACLIAYHMGAKNIGLIGVDFTDHHFNEDDGEHKLNSRLNSIEGDFALLHERLSSKGCNLYNISKVSILKSLPKKPICEFLKKIKK